ncbi:MAG: LamG domain-containing protein [Rhizorhabdus sp.]|uniref:LamG-like jellyroll fold domain-containing protein n=1 Tax=Rhizorhabdus sp. TaxID=1968843 RepID=UPI001B706D68|nr:LamG-like jellyroll fold domain-containing protein [Rhizorhabdus sp.]MBP8231782.1 LamG domain-containing protein [Rhizorhabdus sp.]
MAKVKVPVYGAGGRVVIIDSEGGATIGENLRLPDGDVATIEDLQELLGGTGAHRSLTGLQVGDDHPQYPMKAAAAQISGSWNFTTPPQVGGVALPEYVEDLIGDLMTDSATINFTYDDTAATLTADLTAALDDLTDVSIPTLPTYGDVLTWNGAEWENAPPSAGASALADLTDVDIPTLPDLLDVLTWNGSAWIPYPAAGGSGGGGIVDTIVAGTGINVDASDPSNPIVAVDATLEELSDTTFTGLATGDMLQWNGSAWVNVDPPALSALTDVDIPTLPTYNDVLTWNGFAWESAPTQNAPPWGATLAEEILADSPTAFYKCDEASGDLIDYGSAGVDLALAGSVTYQAGALVPSEVTEAAAALFALIASGSNGFQATSGLGLSYPLTGDYTIEAIVNTRAAGANTYRLFSISGSGETEAANYQAYFNVSSTLEIGCFWEYGAGTNVTIASGVTLVEGQTYHLAMVKDGTANTVAFYVDGAPVATIGYANEPSGGSGTLVTAIGLDGGAGATAEMLIGYVAFYNGSKLSAARIAQHARAAGLM